ncbi:hypothetical protein [Luteibacter sp.]|jgi:hypothetical protein|uniref:hypothetical protein n=1 Tax=Luteibacter sp. TaxID=1886636 RepID=UPI002F40CA65
MLRNTLAASLFSLSLVSWAQPGVAAGQSPVRYVDAIDWPTKEAGLKRFAWMEYALNLSFERLCSDTFCEGSYANLRPMQLSCSVDAAKGTVRQCLWMFSGSNMSVDARSGVVKSSSRVYECKLPLARDTPVESLYDALDSSELLHAKLPMTNRIIYNRLRDCLR